MLYNTEALGYIYEKHINQLEECDKIFMRRLCELEQGTPVEGCFLETYYGKTINFYWTILGKCVMPNKKGLCQCAKLED